MNNEKQCKTCFFYVDGKCFYKTDSQKNIIPDAEACDKYFKRESSFSWKKLGGEI